MTNETQIREALAPKVAAKILSRQGGGTLTPVDADQLAHEIIAMTQAALAAGQHGVEEQTHG